MATDEYLAGIFDGEGSVSMSLAKAGHISICVQVTMCDRPAVAALHRRFGGSFADGKYRTKSGRLVYTWGAYNAGAVEALVVFSELCLVKSVVAEIALPVAISMRTNGTGGALKQEEKAARVIAAEKIAAVNKPAGKRSILGPLAVEAYMKPKKMGGGKAVQLSDGRRFGTVRAAACAIGVSESMVSLAKRKGVTAAGFYVEAV